MTKTDFEVGTTPIIDLNRNLTNIGNITATGNINLTSTTTTSPAITFNTSSGTDTTIDMAIRATGEVLDFYEPDYKLKDLNEFSQLLLDNKIG